MDTMLVLFSMVGLTIIMSSGQIFEKTREWISGKSKFIGELVSCPMCLGFWVGMISAMFFGINPIILAGLVSVFSWSTYNLVDLISTTSLYITNLIMLQGITFGDDNKNDIK
jgi:hypothetical protein